MVSWRNKTLQFLCGNLSSTFDPSFNATWNLKEDSSCGMEFFGHVSFFDFMCLVATAFNKTIGVCSHEVVIKLYSKFGMITATTIPTTLPTTTSTTTLPTTEQPQTTAKLKTTTIKSTATRTCPPTVTASSTSPTTTTTRSLSSEGNVHRRSMVNDPTDKVVTDTVVYTILGLSFILNLLLAFSVAILCQRRYSHGASMNPWPVPISEEDVTTKQVQNSISQTQGKCSAEEWTSSQSHLHVSETMNCSGSESRVKVLNSNRNSACTRPGAQCMSEEDDW
ncbi:probable transcription-associated protein 1 [Periophthalmus magnuspinnatus]|uniref:probable transcription-associated protein 1 n=1 Tax=Periophthalmus magnuspinnatus TaxID=409849 RepID=UPI002436978E|nr:probable transcription-associated protein 1 [Periophthalmus magnuspinnatus]